MIKNLLLLMLIVILSGCVTATREDLKGLKKEVERSDYYSRYHF